MSKIWKHLEPWIDKEKFAFTTFSVILGLWLIYSTLTRQTVKSASELFTITDTLESYSFKNGDRGSKLYFMWLGKHSSTFQIPADFLGYFEKSAFEEARLKGKHISIKISKKDEQNLTTLDNRIVVYEIRKDRSYFLLSEHTIKEDNSSIMYYGGASFVIAGIIFYLYKRRRAP